jgi:hypothetical protein
MTRDVRSRGTASRHISWLVTLCAALGLAACGSSGLAGGSGPSHPAIPAAVLASLTTLAKSSASADGDPNVNSARAVLTTREVAVRVMSGDAVYTNDPSTCWRCKAISPPSTLRFHPEPRCRKAHISCSLSISRTARWTLGALETRQGICRRWALSSHCTCEPRRLCSGVRASIDCPARHRPQPQWVAGSSKGTERDLTAPT